MFLKKVEAMISQDTIHIVMRKADHTIEIAFMEEKDAEEFIGKRVREYYMVTAPLIKRLQPRI